MITSLDGAVADPERFVTIFDAHYEEIRRYIGRRLDLDIAEDLAAETFLIAFRRHDSFDAAKGGIRPWLYGIATNLIGKHRRAEVRRYRALARSGPPPDDDGHDQRVVDRIAAGVTVQKLSPNREGEERREHGDVSAGPLAPADEQAWKDAGSPALCDAKKGRCEVGKVFYVPMDPKAYKPVTRLPTDAETLKAELLKGFPADGSESQEGWLWAAARWLLVDAEATPGTRAALYRMLAGLPEVRVVDGVPDLDGRVGVRLVFGGSPVRQRSGQHLPVQQQIVIDRESGDLLAVQGAEIQLDGSQVGEPFESYVIKKQGWTDEAPTR
ncbi:MAG TPA: sigma factor [Nonomuraea sp.]|nr:sigma factor [Nonomuraea sp.]